jgi:hypothetical protein
MKNTKNKMVPIHPTGQACGFSRHDSYKDHTFKIVNSYEGGDYVAPTVNMEIDSQATIGDLLDAFHCFLKAVGYYPPEHSTLDFISDDKPSYDDDDENY